MQLSDTTLDILRNYSAINQNLLIEPGNVIKTVNESRTILSTATIAESFPKEIGIYDLNEFIGAMSLVQKPTLDFKDEPLAVHHLQPAELDIEQQKSHRKSNDKMFFRPRRARRQSFT